MGAAVMAAADDTDNAAEAGAAMTSGEYRLLADFRYYLRRFTAFSEGATAAAGLSAGQYQALLAINVLGEGGPVTTTALADQLFLRLNSVVELIDRLETAGLVLRTRAEHDRRVMTVALTPHGEAALAPLAARHLAHHRAHASELIDGMSGLLDASD